jgi:putative phosphoribosyl transferase
MLPRFQNRTEAGRLLAGKLEHHYAGRSDVLVLALPRGGVPVAAEIAHRLGVPMDVLIVRKLGLPGAEELAMGAIASGGLRVLNRPVIAASGVSPGVIERVVVQEEQELARREHLYRGDQPPPDVRHNMVIVVDDGIATGSTMRAAVAVLRDAHAGRIVVAAPVAARESYFELRDEADEIAVVSVPREFGAVGRFYVEFDQMTDVEVCDVLSAMRHEWHAGHPGR